MVYDNKDAIKIRIENLDSMEARLFSQLHCQFDADIVVRKIFILNNAYDTMHIWVLDYCHLNKPFVLYDSRREYANDSLVSCDLINTPVGYPIEIIKNKQKVLYMRSKALKKKSKYEYTFWADVDSLGTKKAVEFHFFESN